MRVLLVEDNALNRDMLERRLRRAGHEVVCAEDGRSGVELTRLERPDIVLMDLSLPVLDGFAATRQLRDDPATAAIPIIVLTANALVEDRTRALAAGCDDFQTKPVDLSRLLSAMTRLYEARPVRPVPA
jgi:two-component system cell cycle response regulator DivK